MAEPIKLYKGKRELTVYADHVADELIGQGWNKEQPAPTPAPKKETKKDADDTGTDQGTTQDADTKGGDKQDGAGDSSSAS